MFKKLYGSLVANCGMSPDAGTGGGANGGIKPVDIKGGIIGGGIGGVGGTSRGGGPDMKLKLDGFGDGEGVESSSDEIGTSSSSESSLFLSEFFSFSSSV